MATSAKIPTGMISVDKKPAALPNPNLDSVIFMTFALTYRLNGTIN
jgi:hypothetical protein